MIPFPKGVKFITAVRHEEDGKVVFVEQRLTRAEQDYTRFVKAAFPNNEEGASKAIGLVKEKGFDEIQIFTFRDVFQKWKKEEKSRSAKYSRSKRKADKRTVEQQKALVRDLDRDLGREGTKIFIQQGKAQMTKEKACPQIPGKHRKKVIKRRR